MLEKYGITEKSNFLSLLFYAWMAEAKILTTLSNLESEKYKVIDINRHTVYKRLGYIKINPNGVILYQTSQMRLKINNNSSFLRSHADRTPRRQLTWIILLHC